MNGHLPECPAGYVADLCTTDIDPVLQEPTCNHCVGQGCICICNRLRACEQRVRLHAALSWEQGFEEGRTAGLDAARDAVVNAHADPAPPVWDAMTPDEEKGWLDGNRQAHADALAAIDALRGSGNLDTPPSAEKGEKP